MLAMHLLAWRRAAYDVSPLSSTQCPTCRSGLFDRHVGFWEHSCFAADLRHIRGQLSPCNLDGDMTEPAANVLLRVKAGGHDSFVEAQDDAEVCCYLLSTTL